MPQSGDLYHETLSTSQKRKPWDLLAIALHGTDARLDAHRTRCSGSMREPQY